MGGEDSLPGSPGDAATVVLPSAGAPDPWGALPDPDRGGPGDEGAGSGRYQGRRRLILAGRRTTRWATAAVIAAVGVMLVGSGVLARTFPDPAPVTLPSPPPSAYASSSPAPSVASSPTAVSQLGAAPTPPVPSPTASPSQPPPPPAPSPTPAPAATPAPPAAPALPAPLLPPVDLSFEAEAAELSGGVELVSVPNASGGEVVRLHGWWPGHFVRFTGVTVEAAGAYQLTLHYTSRRCCETTARVVVDDAAGGVVQVVTFPPAAGNSIGTVSVSIELPAGANTLLVTANPDSPAPNLDRIRITG